jgi:F-type H+-transporting ATPase subunit c
MLGNTKRAAAALLFLIAVLLVAPAGAYAQDGAAGGSTIHYMGAGLGAGIAVIGAGIGIGKLTASATESIARQPQAAKDITAAFQLPLFLLEGVAVIALAVCFVIIFQT